MGEVIAVVIYDSKNCLKHSHLFKKDEVCQCSWGYLLDTDKSRYESAVIWRMPGESEADFISRSSWYMINY